MHCLRQITTMAQGPITVALPLFARSTFEIKIKIPLLYSIRKSLLAFKDDQGVVRSFDQTKVGLHRVVVHG